MRLGRDTREGVFVVGGRLGLRKCMEGARSCFAEEPSTFRLNLDTEDHGALLNRHAIPHLRLG